MGHIIMYLVVIFCLILLVRYMSARSQQKKKNKEELPTSSSNDNVKTSPMPDEAESSYNMSSDEGSDTSIHSSSHNDTPADSLENKKKEKLKYRDFLMETLQKIGCQAFISEHDNNVYLKYQGEAFCIVQDRGFIRIWDLPYSEVNVLDTNLPLIIESINSANFSIGPTIVISRPDNNGIREIQSKMDLIFLPSIPNPDKYLAKIFDLFFELKICLRTEIAKWNTPEAQNQPSSLTSSFPYQN